MTTLNGSSESTRSVEIDGCATAEELCSRWRHQGEATVYLPHAPADGGWSCQGLVAHRPETLWSGTPSTLAEARDLFDRIEHVLRSRRRSGGSPETGLMILLSYEALAGPARGAGDTGPAVVVLSVDRSIQFDATGGVARLTTRARYDSSAAAELDRLRRDLDEAAAAPPTQAVDPARVTRQPRTSLPREKYLRAVETVRDHIARGDIYQANVCQRFSAPYAGDAFAMWAGLARASSSPRSAWVEAGGVALASVSPESFLTVDTDGCIATLPIKGTRPRHADPDEDRRAAESLSASAKDRAELLMIVDLERNDLGRVCRVGSVRATSIGDLRSFSSVHHLVGRVEGRLKQDVGFRELVEATFPGGSITGAPKLEAMRILRGLEPVARGLFTGSLIWAADDGSLDSSILIRSPVFTDGRVHLGAGGGIVTDSDAEAEWHESNHKARAAAHALGFEPEEASA